jgi:molybdopterin synthase sulfur carrier subunit
MSTLTVRFFAAAADAAGTEQEAWDLGEEPTLGVLRAQLVERFGDPMRQVLATGSFLVDGVVRRDDGPIEGDRVDVLPPFAGG